MSFVTHFNCEKCSYPATKTVYINFRDKPFCHVPDGDYTSIKCDQCDGRDSIIHKERITHPYLSLLDKQESIELEIMSLKGEQKFYRGVIIKEANNSLDRMRQCIAYLNSKKKIGKLDQRRLDNLMEYGRTTKRK